ncbi:unnamed protein product [Calypogeia fissa]
MFKRQFYALEHSNRGDSASSSSSSSLDTASDVEGGRDVEDDGAWPASSHESDATSEEEVVEAEGATSAHSDVVSSDDESDGVAEGSDGEDGETSDIEPRESQRKRTLSNQWAEAVDDDESERVLQKFEGSTVICVGESNKVFKCRVCPKVVCLSEQSMEAHLASKRHARSLKQLAEGTLKVQLDSDGEEEEEGETHAERFARTISTAQEDKTVKRKRDSGRQRQRKRMKKKALLAAKEGRLAEEVLPVSQPTAKQQRNGKVLKTKKKTSSQTAAVSNALINRSQRKHQPPTSQKKTTSKIKVDRSPKAKRRKLVSPDV